MLSLLLSRQVLVYINWITSAFYKLRLPARFQLPIPAHCDHSAVVLTADRHGRPPLAEQDEGGYDVLLRACANLAPQHPDGRKPYAQYIRHLHGSLPDLTEEEKLVTLVKMLLSNGWPTIEF